MIGPAADGVDIMKSVDAYNKGEKTSIVIVDVEGVPMEISMARAFLRMAKDAFADGILLTPTSGFRSYEQQKALYEARLDPKVRAVRGGAARPGYSAHNSGLAIDIRTGLSYRNYNAGKRTKTYMWLKENAYRYGFAQTIDREPWHYERVVTLED